jgi:hypothetical protein
MLAACHGAGGATKSVSLADCDAWSSHAVDTIVHDWGDAAGTCAPSMRDDLMSKLARRRATILQTSRTACATHVGQPASAANERCYMTATTVKALGDCAFAPMSGTGEAEIASEIAGLRQVCAKP